MELRIKTEKRITSYDGTDIRPEMTLWNDESACQITLYQNTGRVLGNGHQPKTPVQAITIRNVVSKLIPLNQETYLRGASIEQ